MTNDRKTIEEHLSEIQKGDTLCLVNPAYLI